MNINTFSAYLLSKKEMLPTMYAECSIGASTIYLSWRDVIIDSSAQSFKKILFAIKVQTQFGFMAIWRQLNSNRFASNISSLSYLSLGHFSTASQISARPPWMSWRHLLMNLSNMINWSSTGVSTIWLAFYALLLEYQF